MIKEFLDRHVWTFLNSDEEWWTKGFICGVVLTAFIMWRIYN